MEARDRSPRASAGLAGPVRPAVSLLADERYLVACAALAFTVLGILVVHPASLGSLFYYGFIWIGFIAVFHRRELEDFSFAFVINSALIAVFYLVQTWIYPDSYGTTSPLSSSWTDDSHFFSLVADNLPPNLPVRDYYYMYEHTFTNFIRSLTFFSIDHPMDVIFFQSGIAAMLTTYSKRLMQQLSGDEVLANTVYVFTLLCPFLWMNGGAILIRDTFAAALFVYSLCCINERKYPLVLGAVVLQTMLRPGTAVILLPAYTIIYFTEVRAFVSRHRWLAAGTVAVLLFGILRVAQIDIQAEDLGQLNKGVSFLGREVIDDLTADQGANGIFLAIQDMPFLVKLPLNGAYIFLYPFLSTRGAFGGDYFDVRAITMNLVIPCYAFWLNAWFIAGALTRVRVTKRQVAIVVAILVALVLIGTYSLQTRHKTIIYPLYYFVIAIGFLRAGPRERRIGYLLSGSFLALQVALLFR